ncbi:MAG: ubiquitin-activating E1 FCCH domain-containing protein [Phenylobacterium sp.]
MRSLLPGRAAAVRFLRRWFAGRRGNVTIITAISLPVLLFASMGAMDFDRASTAKSALQDSLDAATLYVARSDAVDAATIQQMGAQRLDGNLVNLKGGKLISSTFVPADEGRKIVGTAVLEVESSVVGVFNDNRLEITLDSEVVRASKDIEVSLVLDTTGSMAGQRIIDLREAAKGLVDIVVKDDQSPFYTKVALVPYSTAVNVGALATAARGSVQTMKSITGATKANPVVITSNSHGFLNGDHIIISGVSGMTQLNNKEFVVAGKTNNTFQLQGVDGRNYSSYSSGGKICTASGCELYAFDTPTNPIVRKTFPVSTCVTERGGVDAYTDTAPSAAPFGRHYAGISNPPAWVSAAAVANPCPTNAVTPLSSDKAALKTKIGALQASGSTGGHLGVGWGWYLLSPKFGYMLSGEQKPGAYFQNDLVKAVVLMTDGEYNSSYCNGVISKDSTSGSGDSRDHINCNAPNGHAFDQARTLCARMKQQGVIVYTVGFDVVDDDRARQLVSECATDAKHIFYPNSGAALKEAFKTIAQDLSKLRLAH